MKIAVLVKTVNYIYAQTGTSLLDNYVGPVDSVRMLNPLDEVALEYALQFKDRDPETSVFTIACGDSSCEEGLRRGLAMGADRAVHLHHEGEELDAAATARLLSLVCRRFEFDLILCGAKAIDCNARLEAPFLAARLGIPHVTSVVRLQPGQQKDWLAIERVVERGDRQMLDCRLPALLTMAQGTLTPRYPTLAGFLRGEAEALEVLRADEIDRSVDAASLSNGLTRVINYVRPRPKRKVGAGVQSLKPVPERIRFMVNGDCDDKRTGGKLVDAGSEEMYARLDELLRDAGVLADSD